MPETIEPNEEETEVRAEQRERKWLIVVGLCLFLLMVAGTTTLAINTIQQRQEISRLRSEANDLAAYSECQRRYNDGVIASIRAGRDAATFDRAALKLLARSGSVMIGIILDQSKSQDEKLAAIQQWRADQVKAEGDLNSADTKRTENPLPEPTQC